MSNPETIAQEQLKFLEDLIVNNQDLDELEGMVSEFNIFEAIGMVRQEVRHSAFLAQLLDPNQNHGFGDWFLKRFLKLAVSGKERSRLTAIEIDVAGLGSVEVRREWRNIDILIIVHCNRWVIAVENKIDATESKDQLAKYHAIVQDEFASFEPVFIFLTPDARAPAKVSDAETWISTGYDSVLDLLDQLVRVTPPGNPALLAVKHYLTMMRRHVMTDKKIEELCHKIYAKHRSAIDLIIEKRPDHRETFKALAEDLIGEEPAFSMDQGNRSYIRFSHDCFERFVDSTGQRWTDSKKVVLFEFVNRQDRFFIKLVVGPGAEPVRQGIYEGVKAANLKGRGRKLAATWTQIYQKPILSPRDFEEPDYEQMEVKIRRCWASFVEKDLPVIEKAFDDLGEVPSS